MIQNLKQLRNKYAKQTVLFADGIAARLPLLSCLILQCLLSWFLGSLIKNYNVRRSVWLPLHTQEGSLVAEHRYRRLHPMQCQGIGKKFKKKKKGPGIPIHPSHTHQSCCVAWMGVYFAMRGVSVLLRASAKTGSNFQSPLPIFVSHFLGILPLVFISLRRKLVKE